MPNTVPVSIAHLPKKQSDFLVVYPSEDGTPMAETDTHVNQIIILKNSLELYYQNRQDVSVSANIFLYYEEGDPKKHVSPDVMVTLGVPKHERKSFFVWKEGKAPDVVFEITSDSSIERDTMYKHHLYRELKVQEYYIFNPLADPMTLQNALCGYQSEGNSPCCIALNGEKVVSKVLGLELAIHDKYLRLRDCTTQEWIPTLEEDSKARKLAEKKAQEAEKKAQEAEKKAQEAEKKAQEAEKKAQEEAKARELADKKAQEEAKARELAEKRIRELEQLLKDRENKKN
jgi:Uma2 family endonuclease